MTAPAPAFARFCSRCGRERLPAARFCIACGFRFTDPGPTLEVARELTPDHAYPIRYRVGDDPRRQRALTLFRPLIAVPHLIGWALVFPLSTAVSVISWPVVLVTGRVPAPFHRLQAALLAYVTRIAAYLCLATDTWPPFPWQAAPEYPIQVEVDPPAPFSRLVALVVLPRALPAALTAAMFGVVAWMLAVGAWFGILALGRMPRTIHEMLELSIGFQCRALGHFPLLLTDQYPWYESGPLMLPSRRAGASG
jgi:Domain of unknown function (DUF4389)